MAYRRIINGKPYEYHSRHALKKWAEFEAKALRSQGYKARVIKVNKQYPYEVFTYRLFRR